MEFFHKKTSFPFMHTRKAWYVVSAVLIIGSLLALAVRGREASAVRLQLDGDRTAVRDATVALALERLTWRAGLQD